jgi:hypothetical protein
MRSLDQRTHGTCLVLASFERLKEQCRRMDRFGQLICVTVFGCHQTKPFLIREATVSSARETCADKGKLCW